MEDGQHTGTSQCNQEQDLQQQLDNGPSSKALSYQRKRSDNDPQPSSSFQASTEQQSNYHKNVNERLEEFVRYFVTEFEDKLHAYQLILEGEKKKAGKFSDAFSENVGQGLGAVAGGLAALLLSLPATGVATLVATAGKAGAGKLGSNIGSDQHKKKATNLVHFVGLFQKDKANFRQLLVETGFDVFQSFEMQFMRITTDQGPKRAMQLLAKDATNRAIDYIQKEQTFTTEGVILGKSKTESFWGLPIPDSTIKTPGFEVDYEYRSTTEKWLTASLYEKVGIVKEEKTFKNKIQYYEKKDGKSSRTDKYGYRRLFKSESWYKWKNEYRICSHYDKSVQFTNYKYFLNPKYSEPRSKDILKKINLDDKDLAKERIAKIIEEAKSDIIQEINILKKQSRIDKEDRKILISIETNLKNLNIEEYSVMLKQILEEVKQGQEKIVKSIEASRKEITENLNQLSLKQDIHHHDDMRGHKTTQEGVERIEERMEGNSKMMSEIHGVVVTQERKQLNESVCFDVKEPVSLFTGREQELKDLHNIIQRNSEKVTVISQMTSISGLGGIGKTQLARKYINKHSEDYDSNVMWMDAESESTLSESFSRLAKDILKIKTKDADGREKSIKSIVDEVYKCFSERKSLFVFDNAENIENITKFLPLRSLTPYSNKPYILITSRIREWETGIEIIDVNEFKLEDAVEFVKKGLCIKDETQDQEIMSLVEKLQRFPLAMQQAISYIRDQSLTGKFTIDNYLEEYEKKREDLLNNEVFKGIDNDYGKTTFTTWKITIDKIANNEEHGKLASDVLITIAYFAPENISREMFLEFAESNEKLKAAVRLLVKYSMIHGEKNQSILSVHRLVQEVTRLELRGQGKEDGVLREILIFLNTCLEKGENPTDNIYTSHAVSAWGYATKYEELVKTFSTLPSQIISRLNDAVRYKEAYLFGTETLAVLEHILGPDHADTLSTVLSVADALYKQGKYDEALYKYNEVLTKRKQVLGHDHPDTLSTTDRIAVVLNNIGAHDKALEICEEVIVKKAGNFDPNFLSGMANAFYHLGRDKDAVETDRAPTNLNTDNFSTLQELYTALSTEEPFKEAVTNITTMLAGSGQTIERMFPQFPDMLGTVDNMAVTWKQQGKYDAALKAFQDLLSNKTSLLGTSHLSTLSTMHEIAETLYYQGKYNDAYSKYEEVLGKRKQFLGEDHPDTLTTRNGIAKVLKKQGNNEKALKIFQKVYEERTAKLHENHPDTLSTMHEIAETLYYQGKYNEAYSKYEEVLDKRKHILGADHPDTQTTRNAIAECWKTGEE